MTVQRQYILPNCNLTIEGLIAGEETDPTSPLTVVLNSQCLFPGTADGLSGGREFLNALVKTVSDYAQSLLSGVPYPSHDGSAGTQPVTLISTANQRHQLVATVADASGAETRKTVELNTVQLFDLMEAIDQLLADTLTLPDMTLQLAPLNRRHARPAVPATKRVVPAAVGLSTLAASAALLFMVPVPQFEPQRRQSEDLSQLVEPESANLPGNESTSPPDESQSASDAAANGRDDDTLDDADSVDPVAAGIALGRLASAPTITEGDTLDELENELETTLEAALDEDVPFDQSLVYRVAVSDTGDILGYKYENDAALINIDSTPLPDLTYIPVEPEATNDEPVAQFRVTFDVDGDVTAEPIDSDDAE